MLVVPTRLKYDDVENVPGTLNLPRKKTPSRSMTISSPFPIFRGLTLIVMSLLITFWVVVALVVPTGLLFTGSQFTGPLVAAGLLAGGEYRSPGFFKSTFIFVSPIIII